MTPEPFRMTTAFEFDAPGATFGVLREPAMLAAAEQRFAQAIALANKCLDGEPDELLERLLVEWRCRQFATVPVPPARQDWPPAYADPFPGVAGLPEIQRHQLNAATLAGGILHHGSVLVRGLIDPAVAASLAEGVDHAFAGRMQQGDPYDETLSTPWYRRLRLPSDHLVERSREFVEAGFSGLYMADSPRMLARFMNVLQATRVVPMIAEYMGEPPYLSAGKTTIRRVPNNMTTTSWHQDGAFLGQQVRSVNLWLSLSHCGVDASGLDVVPRRLDYLAERGTPGTYFDWDVSDETARRAALDTPVVSPVFGPGDALLFDHMMLHRTGLPANMTRDRYAIEAWMFAPSHYPMEHLPLFI